MLFPVFVRTTSAFDTEEFYREFTEVLVFGDIDSYRRLIRAIARLHQDKPPSKLIKSQYYGMPVVLHRSDKSRELMISEHFSDESLSMKLKISVGKIAGVKLVRSLENFLNRPEGCLDDHIHFGDSLQDAKSVALNFRYPLKKWDEKQLGIWKAVILKKRTTYLPDGMRYRIKS